MVASMWSDPNRFRIASRARTWTLSCTSAGGSSGISAVVAETSERFRMPATKSRVFGDLGLVVKCERDAGARPSASCSPPTGAHTWA